MILKGLIQDYQYRRKYKYNFLSNVFKKTIFLKELFNSNQDCSHES